VNAAKFALATNNSTVKNNKKGHIFGYAFFVVTVNLPFAILQNIVIIKVWWKLIKAT
jgi:hypothetical protein